jgi:hypothetical protein
VNRVADGMGHCVRTGAVFADHRLQGGFSACPSGVLALSLACCLTKKAVSASSASWRSPRRLRLRRAWTRCHPRHGESVQMADMSLIKELDLTSRSSVVRDCLRNIQSRILSTHIVGAHFAFLDHASNGIFQPRGHVGFF